MLGNTAAAALGPIGLMIMGLAPYDKLAGQIKWLADL